MIRLAFAALALLVATAGRVEADSPHKQTAPLDMVSVVHGVPHAGQTLEIDITITPHVAITALQLSFVGSEGLDLDISDTPRNFQATAAQQSRTVNVEATPRVAGMQRLHVIAIVGGIENGATRRTWTIDLPVDVTAADAALSQKKAIPTDATGQKIHSMHGTSR